MGVGLLLRQREIAFDEKNQKDKTDSAGYNLSTRVSGTILLYMQ